MVIEQTFGAVLTAGITGGPLFVTILVIALIQRSFALGGLQGAGAGGGLFGGGGRGAGGLGRALGGAAGTVADGATGLFGAAKDSLRKRAMHKEDKEITKTLKEISSVDFWGADICKEIADRLRGAAQEISQLRVGESKDKRVKEGFEHAKRVIENVEDQLHDGESFLQKLVRAETETETIEREAEALLKALRVGIEKVESMTGKKDPEEQLKNEILAAQERVRAGEAFVTDIKAQQKIIMVKMQEADRYVTGVGALLAHPNKLLNQGANEQNGVEVVEKHFLQLADIFIALGDAITKIADTKPQLQEQLKELKARMEAIEKHTESVERQPEVKEAVKETEEAMKGEAQAVPQAAQQTAPKQGSVKAETGGKTIDGADVVQAEQAVTENAERQEERVSADLANESRDIEKEDQELAAAEQAIAEEAKDLDAGDEANAQAKKQQAIQQIDRAIQDMKRTQQTAVDEAKRINDPNFSSMSSIEQQAESLFDTLAKQRDRVDEAVKTADAKVREVQMNIKRQEEQGDWVFKILLDELAQEAGYPMRLQQELRTSMEGLEPEFADYANKQAKVQGLMQSIAEQRKALARDASTESSYYQEKISQLDKLKARIQAAQSPDDVAKAVADMNSVRTSLREIRQRILGDYQVSERMNAELKELKEILATMQTEESGLRQNSPIVEQEAAEVVNACNILIAYIQYLANAEPKVIAKLTVPDRTAAQAGNDAAGVVTYSTGYVGEQVTHLATTGRLQKYLEQIKSGLMRASKEVARYVTEHHNAAQQQAA